MNQNVFLSKAPFTHKFFNFYPFSVNLGTSLHEIELYQCDKYFCDLFSWFEITKPFMERRGHSFFRSPDNLKHTHKPATQRTQRNELNATNSTQRTQRNELNLLLKPFDSYSWDSHKIPSETRKLKDLRIRQETRGDFKCMPGLRVVKTVSIASSPAGLYKTKVLLILLFHLIS